MYAALAVLELRDPPASAPWVLKLKVCTTMPSLVTTSINFKIKLLSKKENQCGWKWERSRSWNWANSIGKAFKPGSKLWSVGAGDMAHWLKGDLLLPQIWVRSSVPMHATHNCLCLQFQGIWWPLTSSCTCNIIHKTHTGIHTYKQTKSKHILKEINCKFFLRAPREHERFLERKLSETKVPGDPTPSFTPHGHCHM